MLFDHLERKLINKTKSNSMNFFKFFILTVSLLFLSNIQAQIQLEVEGIGTAEDVIRLTNNNFSRIANYSASSDPNAIPLYIGYKSRGTTSNPSNLLPLDRITGFYGGIYAGNQYRLSAAVEMYAGETISTNSSSSSLRFGTTNENSVSRTEKMRITPEGYIGIGTTDPSEKLEISNGDIYLSGISNGIIMTSPNGSCWRVTIDDAGNFISTAITCP